MDSKFRKTERVVRLDGIATGAALTPVRINLKKESLVVELKVRIDASQTWAGGAPTSVDVRRFIKDISIETSDGRRKFMTGYQAYDFSRITEAGDKVTNSAFTTGVNTSSFNLDLHFENDGALHDIMAAIDASKLNTFDLVVNFAPDISGGFIGGTTAGVASYTVTARSVSYPAMRRTKEGLVPHYVDALRHINETQSVAGAAGAGTPIDFRLTSGNKTRFLCIHAFDTTGAIPTLSNAVLADLRVIINGEEKRITTFLETQKENVSHYAFDQVGTCFISWDEDEGGWLDTRGVNEPKLTVVLGPAVPASYRIDVGQDYSVVMKD